MTETECLENKLIETQCELEKALERADMQFKAHTAQYNLHCETKAQLEQLRAVAAEMAKCLRWNAVFLLDDQAKQALARYHALTPGAANKV